MKTTKFLRTTSGLIAGSLVSLATAQAAETEKDALPQAENYIKISSQYQGVSGDKAAFEAQSATARHGFAGIEAIEYSKALKKDYELKLSGRALVGNADYLASFKLSNANLGSFDAGYSSFRTYYDGLGGFFPGNNMISALRNQGLSVDRSKLWAGITVTLPDAPVFSLKYTMEDRKGTKDTTIWGDTDYTYNPAANAFANRKIIASSMNVNESRQTLDGTVKHTFGHTTVLASVIGERIDNDNTRFLNRYPGQARAVGATSGNSAIQGYQKDIQQTTSLATILKVKTEIGDKFAVFAGFKYQNATTDLSGARLLYTTVNTTGGQIQQLGGVIFNGSLASPPTTGNARGIGSYQDLSGSSHTKHFAVNVGADIKPVKHLYIETALKYEDRFTRNDVAFTYLHNLVNQTTGVVTSYSRPYNDNSEYDESAIIPEISIRYNGISKLSLYATGEARLSPGTEKTFYNSTGTNVGTIATLDTTTDVEENHAKYTIGANWSPLSLATVRTELFYKDHRNDFDAAVVATPTALPNENRQFILGTKYAGARLTLTVKPIATLSSTTRYVYQKGTMDLAVTGIPAVAGAYTRYPGADSMDSTMHQIGETIDWSPTKQIYFQVAGNITFDTTSTAYPLTGATTANDVIRNADNNYWSAHALAGFVVSKTTNLEVQYTHYEADNYRSTYWTTPLGAGETRQTATAGVKQKLTDKLMGELKVGYVKYESDTTGGYADYDAKAAYVSLQYAF